MVKEALFNIIQFDVEGRRVLDLFAGTGQLGIEALSRGAESAVFVDESVTAVRLIRENLAQCGFSGEVALSDAARYLKRGGQFDLVFADPPYNSEQIDKILQKIYEFDILTTGGIIICETKKEHEMPEMPPPYSKRREYRYGKVKLTVYEKLTEEGAEEQ